MKKYPYILFDLDGTLTDPKEGITKCIQHSLKPFGIIEKDIKKLEKFIGPPLLHSYMEYYGFSKGQAKEAISYYRERFSAVGWYENEIYPGMPDLLKSLCVDGRKLAVGSSKPTIFVEKICRYFEIDMYFHHMLGSNIDGTRMEKEEVITEAVRRFENVEKEEFIMVGDRCFDIEGAHAAGMAAVGVTYGYGGAEELKKAGADDLVSTVEELKLLLLEGIHKKK